MTSREQIFAILRNLKWLIAISFVISVVLFQPDQVRELYRISAADGGWTAIKQFVAISAIALFIWFGAFQLATDALQRLQPLNERPRKLVVALPIVLGLLPILAAMFAQLYAMPNAPVGEKARVLREVGSIFRIQERTLAYDVPTLLGYFLIFLVIAILFLSISWRTGAKTRSLSVRANASYYSSYRFLSLTIGLIAFITAIFVLVPDRPAQWLETFGIVALFTLCVVSFSVHVSLLTIDHRFPYFPVLFAVGLLFSWLGSNDNHHIRQLSDQANVKSTAPPRMSAAAAIADWLKQPDRMDAAKTMGEYPVFILSAQGGGIYAAQNAAMFLARMQDLCPGFRRHLFAISSVSGGSIGAAVFAAALHSADQETATKPPAEATACSRIGQFLAGAQRLRNLDDAGVIEQKVHAALSADLLSPLVAASLFPDFSQTFIPLPIPPFDRARSLEYTLENAADRMRLGPAGSKQTNLLTQDYQSHWRPDNGIPALLINTSDAGSGKRVLISPFDIDTRHPTDVDLCMLANVERPEQPEQRIKSTSLQFSLSTAAFISARFPWVTPAATVKVKNDCITKHKNGVARLVDGGYIDNSGVETALNLVHALEEIRNSSDVALPKFRIYLISLTGGDFPDREAFSFNEFMEPIRALLNGRTSRAYIALNRAKSWARVTSASDPTAQELAKFLQFSKTQLSNDFYGLPLGWALSDKTRQIISQHSGRFWDCEPDIHFSQSRRHLSNADCVQIQIYHLVNNSTKLAEALQQDDLRVRSLLRAKMGGSNPAEKLDHEKLLECYEHKWFHERDENANADRLARWHASTDKNKPAQFRPLRERNLAYFQIEHIKALLTEWDRLRDETNPRVLAYLLGSLSYDSADFTRTTENLSFRSESEMPRAWRSRINALKDQNAQTIELQSVWKDPQKLANAIWGGPNNDFGNTEVDDGWRYRPRGVHQIVGREQYVQLNKALSELNPDLGLNIVDFPNAVWNRDISAKIALAHLQRHRYKTKAGELTLIELLKDQSNDWKTIRAIQNEMDRSPAAQASVAERSEVFMGCIKHVMAADATGLLDTLKRFARQIAGLIVGEQ